MGKSTKPSIEKLVETAEIYAGVVTDVAKALGKTRQTVYTWMEEEPEFKEAMNYDNDLLVDLSMQGLRYHLEQKSEKSIHYTLDRLARNKGFGLHVKHQDKNKVDEQLAEMSNEELIEHMAMVNRKIGGNGEE